MTLEEAAERILKGRPWMPCRSCNGIGNDPEATADYKAEVRAGGNPSLDDYRRDCPTCIGEGFLVDVSYREACEMLGKPLPNGLLAS